MKPENACIGQWLRLSALDTLFFRGAERFDADAGGGSYLKSLFPPHPGTVFAAFNSTLLKANALQRATEEDYEHEDGGRSSPDHYFSRGPWLHCKERGLLLPAPAALLTKNEGPGQASPLHRLQPSSALYKADLGTRSDEVLDSVRLPHAPGSPRGVKTLENAWLNIAGYRAWLDGKVPASNQCVRAGDLWSIEHRTGLERDGERRTAVDGMLYSAGHIRLQSGVSLVLHLPDVGKEVLQLLPRHMALGGEGRAVWVDDLAPESPVWPSMPQLEPVDGKLRYTLSLITPGMGAKWGVAAGGVVHEGVPGQIVCCALGHPLRIGGFDTTRNQPERIRSARAAGSVWWMEADVAQADEIRSLHNTCIGAAIKQGYGHVMVGAWSL